MKSAADVAEKIVKIFMGYEAKQASFYDQVLALITEYAEARVKEAISDKQEWMAMAPWIDKARNAALEEAEKVAKYHAYDCDGCGCDYAEKQIRALKKETL